METTLRQLKVAHEPVRGLDAVQAERLASIQATLPHQQHAGVVEEAALRFGLPMTGQEIHERVRHTLRPRWRLSLAAKVGVSIFAILTVVLLGVLLPWAWWAWAACVQGRTNCADPNFGFVASLIVGLLAFGIGGAILGGNLQQQERTSRWTTAASYTAPIPVAALLKLADATASKLFKAFYVVEPGYAAIRPQRQVDPWLIGSVFERVDHTLDPTGDGRRGYVVLAYWE